MKDKILSILDMKDIIKHYNIDENRNMCICPFHEDKKPSLKIYDKSFYCFGCNKTGDLIEFVQQLFNLNFKEAMQKINIDFNLNLNFYNTKEKKKKLYDLQNKYKLEKNKKELIKKIKTNKYSFLCNKIHKYNNIIEKLKKECSFDNWEEKVEIIAFYQDKIEQLDIELNNIFI